MNSTAYKKFSNQFERFMANPPKKVFCPLKPEKIISQKWFSRTVQVINYCLIIPKNVYRTKSRKRSM